MSRLVDTVLLHLDLPDPSRLVATCATFDSTLPAWTLALISSITRKQWKSCITRRSTRFSFNDIASEEQPMARPRAQRELIASASPPFRPLMPRSSSSARRSRSSKRSSTPAARWRGSNASLAPCGASRSRGPPSIPSCRRRTPTSFATPLYVEVWRFLPMRRVRVGSARSTSPGRNGRWAHLGSKRWARKSFQRQSCQSTIAMRVSNLWLPPELIIF